jgi:hypothetical protein
MNKTQIAWRKLLEIGAHSFVDHVVDWLDKIL